MDYKLRLIGTIIMIPSGFLTLVWLYGLISALNPPYPSYDLGPLIFFAALTIVGFLVLRQGENNLNLLQHGTSLALSQLREKGYIDSFDLSNKLRKPVLEIRKMLSYAQKEGIIPFDANIK